MDILVQEDEKGTLRVNMRQSTICPEILARGDGFDISLDLVLSRFPLFLDYDPHQSFSYCANVWPLFVQISTFAWRFLQSISLQESNSSVRDGEFGLVVEIDRLETSTVDQHIDYGLLPRHLVVLLEVSATQKTSGNGRLVLDALAMRAWLSR